jgi:ubiquinone/menaquinone biosynthesis C-methylase UbiE
MDEMRYDFEGHFGGLVYDLIASITGYGRSYYRRAALAIPVQPGMTLVDLGCGTASLSIALSHRMEGRGKIVGIDRSTRQLKRAREKVRSANVDIELIQSSVGSLPVDDESVDGICVSQVLHALPDNIRTACLYESHRILVPNGFFALLEWSKPRFGYTAAVWTATLIKLRNSENWRGTYPSLLNRFGFRLATDTYLDSLNRCQIFSKRS